MSNNINLLLKKRAQKNQQERVLILFKRFSLGCLIITIIMSFILFILAFDPSLASVMQQEDTVLTNLTFSKNKIAKYLFIKNRLESANIILRKRYPMDSSLYTVLQSVPEHTVIDSLDMTDKLLTLRLSSASLTNINTAADNLTSLMKGRKVFRKLTVENIISDARDGVYKLVVQADLL